MVSFVLFVASPYLLLRDDDASKDDRHRDDNSLPMAVDYDDHPPLDEAEGSHQQPDLNILSMKQRDNDPMGNPIVLWWTPFTGEIGTNRKCGAGTCFFTQVRFGYLF